MTKADIVTWIKQEFLPVELATGEGTILQVLSNAIRYFNTHSAFPVAKMFDCTPSNARIQLSTEYKNVVEVYPASTPDWILQNFPLWSLLGISIIDNLTGDLVTLSEAYRNYRYYIGTDFHFHYEKSDVPATGGWLYLSNLPSNTTKIYVKGTYRIQDEGLAGVEVPITSETVLAWLLPYTKALVKMVEGNALRKADAIKIQNDGQQLYNEGVAEKKELEEVLEKSGRWLSFARKF